MIDMGKIISGLQRCRLMNKVNCDKCPYDYNGRGNGKSECTAELADDVLTLLKEQENEEERILKIVWDVLHGCVSTDTKEDQDYVYELIRNRVHPMY